MIGLAASMDASRAISSLSTMQKRVRTPGPFLAYAGHAMATRLVPNTIRQNSPGWPAPKSRPGGRPLLDTGNLANHVEYAVSGSRLTVFSRVPYGPPLQYGYIRRRRGSGGRFSKGKQTRGFAYRWLSFRTEYMIELNIASALWFWRGISQGHYPMMGGNPGGGRR